MATHAVELPAAAKSIPKLYNGDHLSRLEFERRYAASPDIRKAELVEGVVYVQAALSVDHGQPHTHLTLLLATYCAYTPHVGSFDNSTIRLDDENEPQPD